MTDLRKYVQRYQQQFLKDPITGINYVPTPFLDAILGGREQRSLIVTYSDNNKTITKTIILTKYAKICDSTGEPEYITINPDDLKHDATVDKDWNSMIEGIINSLMAHDGFMEWRWENPNQSATEVEYVSIQLL